MDQLHLLILLCFSMLIGSFLSGTVPMAFKLSESKSRLLALMGSGILVGTALAIIIPEGIDSIYAKEDSLPLQTSDHSMKPVIPDEPVQLWIIGVSLVSGFVLMLLIDQFSLYQAGAQTGNHQGFSAAPSNRQEYLLANQEEEDDRDEIGDGTTSPNLETTSETKPIRVSIRTLPEGNFSDSNRIASSGSAGRGLNRATPTLGLVIHASADGIALGAAATTSHRDVEMIIFLAIMLHKAPAAFSLVVFLIHRGLKHSTIRRHLLAFSLSAPLAALLTYFGLSQSGKESLRRNNATGIAMLFSAGTFLYVATVHVLPELVHNRLLSSRELLFLIGGAFLPILLAQMI